MIEELKIVTMMNILMISILLNQAVVLCEEDSMCGGFTFKGVQLQEDTVHEVTLVMIMIMMMVMIVMMMMIVMMVMMVMKSEMMMSFLSVAMFSSGKWMNVLCPVNFNLKWSA